MSEFLLELFSEEIPAGLQSSASADLARLIREELDRAGLTYGNVATYATPRRLTLVIDAVAACSPDLREERKGPRVGAPEKAVEGFLRSSGLSDLSQCEMIEDKKGAFYVAVIDKPGLAAEYILAAAIPAVIRAFPWPKSMRWGCSRLRWVRPLHSILALLGGKVIALDLDGVACGDTTCGHRFMAPARFRVKDFADYEARLRKAFVLLRPDERAATIAEQAHTIAAKAGLALVEDDALLHEAAGLVEWPQVLMGRFDESFLAVPGEVLTSSMKKHQKCFSLRDPKSGKLANHFLLVSNLVARDRGAAIINGNERVIRARLSDAVFFWEQDRKHRLDDNLAQLDAIIFHEKLGTQGERVKRITALARDIAHLVKADPDEAARAATLSKADLVTKMVGEFPDLQGVMGRYYAAGQGEAETVTRALEEHYMPKGASNDVPSDPVSLAVAIADKLDTLIGFWTINEKPTGSKDPYALRRAALGIIRILLENNIRLDLFRCMARPFARVQGHIEQALLEEQMGELGELADHGFPSEVIERFRSETLQSEIAKSSKIEELMQLNRARAIDLLAFFADRLKVYMRERGARYDLIDAIYSLGGQDDLVMIVKRVEALNEFLASDDGANLLIGVRRAVNILAKEEKRDGGEFEEPCDDALLLQAEEIALYKAMKASNVDIDAALATEDFIGAMTALARLRAPVDAFFDKVTVNADDPALRRNRLRLLAMIRRATKKVADFTKIEG